MAPAIPRRAATALIAAALIAVGGCGTGERATPSSPARPPASSPAGTEGTGTASAQSITATMTDYAIELSVPKPPAGTVTFVAEQAGQAPHALAIRGPGVDAATAAISAGGPAQRLTVTLQPGTYQVWCPVGNHRALGMELAITVP